MESFHLSFLKIGLIQLVFLKKGAFNSSPGNEDWRGDQSEADIGGADAPPPPPPPLRDSTPCRPKGWGPPFGTFQESHFWPTDPKIFLKAPLAPIYTNFEGKIFEESSENQFVRPKKKGRQNFPKFLENPPSLEKMLIRVTRFCQTYLVWVKKKSYCARNIPFW